MILPSATEIYLHTQPIDFRKGIRTLAILVESELEMNPFSGQLFLFTNRRHDRVKVLYWDRTGFCLWMKVLEEARFIWPDSSTEWLLTPEQFQWLISGCNLSQIQAHKALTYQSVL